MSMSSMAGATRSSASGGAGASTGDTDAHLVGRALRQRRRGGSPGADALASVGKVPGHAAGIAAQRDGAEADQQAHEVGEAQRVADVLLDDGVEGKEKGSEEGAVHGVQSADSDDEEDCEAHQPYEFGGGNHPLPSREKGAPETGDAGGQCEGDDLGA